MLQDIITPMKGRDLEKAALRGEPSYVWREGQQRRLDMIAAAAGPRLAGWVLEDGCGVGMYIQHMAAYGGRLVGLEYDFERARQAASGSSAIMNGAGELLPFRASTFDLVLSHEVLEHVQNDRAAVREMVRVLKPGGRAVLFCPNRGYPFETHGIYWRGTYRFGNKLFINYLPRLLRDRLAPHVRAYTVQDLERLLDGLPVRVIERRIIYGGYDNIVARLGAAGKALRTALQFLEKTPMRFLGLSHFWVMEKT